MTTSVIPTTPSGQPAPTVPDDRACIQCSYNLRGLPVAGVCPECGTPVERSLRGFMLRYASRQYLRTLKTGLTLIIGAILGLVVLLMLTIVGVVFQPPTVFSRVADAIVLSGLFLALTAVAMLGYWRFTQPDPGFCGNEKPDAARSVIRIVVAIQAVDAGAAFLPDLLGAGGVAVPDLRILWVVLQVVSTIAWIVQFFAVMRYSRWIARRVPDRDIERRTRTYMWLLPVLFTVGILAFGLGPLVAIVLYFGMLSQLRAHIGAILAAVEREAAIAALTPPSAPLQTPQAPAMLP